MLTKLSPSLMQRVSLRMLLSIEHTAARLRGSPACVEVLSLDLLISCAGHAASYVLYLTSHVPGHRFFRTIKMILVKSLHFGCIERHEPYRDQFCCFFFHFSIFQGGLGWGGWGGGQNHDQKHFCKIVKKSRGHVA